MGRMQKLVSTATQGPQSRLSMNLGSSRAKTRLGRNAMYLSACTACKTVLSRVPSAKSPEHQMYTCEYAEDLGRPLMLLTSQEHLIAF